METFAEKLPVPAHFISISHFPELLSEDGLISYAMPVFCLHLSSSAPLNDILVPAFSTVIIAAIYLIATHCQPLSACSMDSPRYQMHNAFPSSKSDLARICPLGKNSFLAGSPALWELAEAHRGGFLSLLGCEVQGLELPQLLQTDKAALHPKQCQNCVPSLQSP